MGVEFLDVQSNKGMKIISAMGSRFCSRSLGVP